MQKNKTMDVHSLVSCALLTAIAVACARLPFLSFAPTETTRYSLETLPIFICGMLFGPTAGAMVGFASDFIGCLFSAYGFHPLFCIPPILLGLSAGMFRPLLKKQRLPQVALAYLIPMVLGYILYQSAALAFVYHKEQFLNFFTLNLISRSIQYGILYTVDVLLVWLLGKTGIWERLMPHTNNDKPEKPSDSAE